MQSEPPNTAALAPTALVDSDHPEVVAFARTHAQGHDDTARAVALYNAVRDGFRYDPYRIDLSPAGMRASSVLSNGYGWCVPKAALLAAVARASGIPARLGFADVRNHLSTERMRQVLQSDVYAWHGYTELWLDGAWRKATPAFNLALCDRFGLLPLEFNGRARFYLSPLRQAPATGTWSTCCSAAPSTTSLCSASARISSACTHFGSKVARRCAAQTS
jgi:transglutaminase-like putative cysteine protease